MIDQGNPVAGPRGPSYGREMRRTENPVTKYRTQGYVGQEQTQPGITDATLPVPDHGERTYVGQGRLEGMRTLITGGDSGIGRAVAIAFAREGADVAISYLPEEEVDAEVTAGWIEQAGQRSLRLPGDIREITHCSWLIDRVRAEFGGLDVLVLNAAYQKRREGLETVSPEEIQRVFDTNLLAPVWTARAAIPHLESGASIIVTSSIQAFNPSPDLIDYAMTKAALVAFTKALAQELGPRGIRVNAVAPGPIWTPLIPATGWPEQLPQFGQDTPIGRAGQPAELAAVYVLLASTEASYISGAVVPVTGGKGL